MVKVKRPLKKQVVFEKILQEINRAGDFKAAVLSTTEGLSLASAPANYKDEMAAAMVALLNKVTKQARQQLNLTQVDELSLVGDDRTRLACRYFSVAGQDLVLAVLVPSNRYYRRLTNQAIRKIKRAWLG
jgi:predicted regulator of Ras-like GTPase activity (Roadblock/LC7/MglB family)